MDFQFRDTTTPFTGSSPMDDPSMRGYLSTRLNQDQAYRVRSLERARLMADVIQGRVDPIFLKEAANPRNEVLVAHLMEQYPRLWPAGIGLRETMSVTDYQALYVDVIDRLYYGYYKAYPIVNKGLVRVHTLRDLRVVSRYLLDGVVTPLTSSDPAAPPGQKALSGPVPQNAATFPTPNTAPIQYQPLLWQSSTATNWAAMVNDDLGIFNDLSNRLAIQGNRGISKFITGKYMDASGPNASLYNSGYANLIVTANGAASSNPILSQQGLQDGMKILAGMKDASGDPIYMGGKLICWYGPENTAVAQNLRHQLSSYISVEGGTTNSAGFPSQFVQTDNWVVQNMEWVLDPYVPIVGPSSGKSWGLMIDPSTLNRPSIEVGFLAGWETPQLLQKAPNTMRMGGGLDATLGDFDSMDSRLKIVTVFGGTQIDGRGAVASSGAGP